MNKILKVIISATLMLSCMTTAQGIDVNGHEWVINNETYTTNTTLTFYNIYTGGGTWIEFNNTDWNITSTNAITITIMYLHSSPTTADNDAEILDFYADTSSGSVSFTLGGFKASTDYAVKRGGTTISSLTSNSNGYITFTNDVWSTQHFEIFGDSGEVALAVSNPYPANSATSIERPPTNLSAQINGTSLDVYIYFSNMTGTSDSWDLVTSWSSGGTARYAYTDFTTEFTNSEFVFGNTTYTWSINTTDGSSWSNNTYTYTTNATTPGGANARYDVSNNNVVSIQDALYVWNYREGEETYNHIYDVSNNDRVTIQDVLYVWNGRE